MTENFTNGIGVGVHSDAINYGRGFFFKAGELFVDVTGALQNTLPRQTRTRKYKQAF
jgi:hypothetical protein